MPLTPAPTTPDEYRCGWWNLRVGRPKWIVWRQVRRLLLGRRRTLRYRWRPLDVLGVCEAAGYVAYLADRLPRIGYRLHGFPHSGSASARDSALIVRDGHRVEDVRLHRLESTGWERGHGRPGLHTPRSAVSARVDGLPFLAAHLPPGPFGGPKWTGRRTANLAAIASLEQLAATWADGFVWPGDYNRQRTDAAIRALVRRSGAVAYGQGRGIDYVLAAGVAVSRVRRLIGFGTSDHWPILFRVTRGSRTS